MWLTSQIRVVNVSDCSEWIMFLIFNAKRSSYQGEAQSVQFSSRWKNPYALYPVSVSEVSLMLPLKQFQCWSDWRWPCLVLSRKDSRALPPSVHNHIITSVSLIQCTLQSHIIICCKGIGKHEADRGKTEIRQPELVAASEAYKSTFYLLHA